MTKLLLLFLFATITVNIAAQTTTQSGTKTTKSTKKSKKKKDKESVEPYFTGREKVKNGIRIYRIHLITSSDRDLVYSTKSKMYQKYPNQKQIVMNAFPMYKLWFGSFLTKAEAVKYQKAINPMFAGGTYIITDIVEHKVITRTIVKPKPLAPSTAKTVTKSTKKKA